MGRYVLALLIMGVCALTGCDSPLGGPKIENKTSTYANNVEVKNIQSYSNPTPQNP